MVAVGAWTMIAGCSAPARPHAGDVRDRREKPASAPPAEAVPALESVLRGGPSYDAAAKIDLGRGPARHRVRLDGRIQHFRFEGRPGHRIDVSVHADNAASVKLQDAAHGHAGGQVDAEVRLEHLPGAGLASYRYYVLMTAVHQEASGTLDVRLVDNTDGGSGRDAGRDLDSAVEMTGSSLAGWLSGGCLAGTDRHDVVRFPVSRDQPVRLRVTPPSRMRMVVRIYGPDRTKLFERTGGGEGAVVGHSWTPDAPGAAYVEVESFSGDGGEYKVEIEK